MKHQRPEPFAAARAALAALAGCMVLLPACDTLGTRPAPAAPPALRDLQELAGADTATQASLVAGWRTQVERDPSAGATLRYALALALPGHAAHDPAHARRLLDQALSRREDLSPTELALAVTTRAQVESLLSLQQALARSAEDAQQERDNQAAARTSTARRLQAEIEDNARLRRALDEARAKLEALAAIEKSAARGAPVPESRRP